MDGSTLKWNKISDMEILRIIFFILRTHVGHYVMSRLRLIGIDLRLSKRSFRKSFVPCAVWHVALSCWNQGQKKIGYHRSTALAIDYEIRTKLFVDALPTVEPHVGWRHSIYVNCAS